MTKKRHKVFVSYHHDNDQDYRDEFEKLFADYHDIMVSKSVQIGDIRVGLKTETVRQKIRDEYIRDSTVIVVLIGPDTWRRKHVDWEIAASLRDTEYNPKMGLVGIFLPTYPGCMKCDYDKYTIPKRLSKNVDIGYAKLYDWSTYPEEVQNWIHEAFKNRKDMNPHNSDLHYGKNKTGDRWSD